MQCQPKLPSKWRSETRSAVDLADPRLKDLNDEINTQTKDHRQEKWLEHLENCGPGSGTKKLWDTIKSIDKPPRQPYNKSIKFYEKHFNNKKKINLTHSTHPAPQTHKRV